MVNSLIEAFSLALRQLYMKKIRTLLILLGISVGVAAVVGVTSLGEGIRLNAVEKIQKSNDLTLVEVSAGLINGGIIQITESKVSEVKEYGGAVAPYVKDAYVTLNKTYFDVLGISVEYKDVTRLNLESGIWFEKGTYQIVLGNDVAEKFEKIEEAKLEDNIKARIRLYGEEGRAIDKDITFKLVGRLKPTGTEIDNKALMDINAAKELDKKDFYDGIMVKVDMSSQTPSARAAIEKLGLSVYSAQDEIDSVNRIMNGVTLVLAFFSGISLIVGGLMIINTMMISVYERTREIGIAKAIGASELDIIKMFIYECIIIGIAGGILGDLLGITFSFLIDRVGKPMLITQLGIGEFEHLTSINMELLVSGFFISLIISIVSGIYPAWSAAKLDPVKALRHL
jgi:putative ABC transport system permease protein